MTLTPVKPVIYQLVVRYFGNTNLTNEINGRIDTNGCGKFSDINATALQELRRFGVTHIWLTGCLRQATLTDYSHVGLPADHPDIVKGIAGSFYAIRDLYDVCPDYASDPAERMLEFHALVDRAHNAGLQVLIDFVPNHVSRGYSSVTGCHDNLGQHDQRSVFFNPQNHFFYLVDPPNQVLRLSKPESWNPAATVFDGRFAPEDGSPGHPPRATGNNCTSPSPLTSDWYETIKLNYGYDFATQRCSFSPTPRTWISMDAVLAFWQSKGIDGFRCDFAHYIPAEAWTFLISRARSRRETYFFAEAYPNLNSTDPIRTQEQLIEAGFDAVYHYESYNALKSVYQGAGLDAYDYAMVGLSEQLKTHVVSYLENHDERRLASPIVTGAGTGASGFGSAAAGYQLAPLQFLYSNAAAMIFNGQEVGEPGVGPAGFGGDDGRTTIYDYWTMPVFAGWVNGHRYDGAGLSDSQLALRRFYSALLNMCQHPCIRAGGFWGLWYFNRASRFPDCPDNLYSFARFAAASGEAVLVVANFRVGEAALGQLRVPPELIGVIGLGENVAIDLILDRNANAPLHIMNMSTRSLAEDGFTVTIPDQTCHVYSVKARHATRASSSIG